MLDLLAQAATSLPIDQAIAWVEHGVAVIDAASYAHHFISAAAGGAVTLALRNRRIRLNRSESIFEQQRQRGV